AGIELILGRDGIDQDFAADLGARRVIDLGANVGVMGIRAVIVPGDYEAAVGERGDGRVYLIQRRAGVDQELAALGEIKTRTRHDAPRSGGRKDGAPKTTANLA